MDDERLRLRSGGNDVLLEGHGHVENKLLIPLALGGHSKVVGASDAVLRTDESAGRYSCNSQIYTVAPLGVMFVQLSRVAFPPPHHCLSKAGQRHFRAMTGHVLEHGSAVTLHSHSIEQGRRP